MHAQSKEGGVKALILVDLQNDFMPGGALPVPDGFHAAAVANRIQKEFDLVVATQDWHPADHGSFAANHLGKSTYETIDLNGLQQVLWPVHCIQNTHGAAFVESLDLSRIARVFQKGCDASIDSYSGFFDNGRRKATGLDGYLRERNVRVVAVCGVATDYCVKATALDAVSLGFKTILLADACRGVNVHEGDVELAIGEMRNAGIEIVKDATGGKFSKMRADLTW